MQGNWFQQRREDLLKYGPTPELVARLRRRIGKTPVGLVNHFTVGGDPEFALLGGPEAGWEHGGYIHASILGLNTGGAFGADLCGRQVELRLRASRSTLEVVASAMVTLRWFSAWLQHRHPKLKATFVCQPYFNGDGLGGHVHFGRRNRALSKLEWLALDRLQILLEEASIFDRTANDVRRHGTRYGANGDVRRQRYGYEYRTFPTWLASPAQAMTVLTLAKLAVFDPTIVTKCPGIPAQEWLPAVALLYAARGDRDAAIVTEIFQANLQGAMAAATFGSAWGLPAFRVAAAGIDYYPAMIPPTGEDVELTRRAMFGVPPDGARMLYPNWAGARMPEGWKSLPATGMRIGEYIHGLVYCPTQLPVNRIGASHGGHGLQIGLGLSAQVQTRLGPGWKKTVVQQFGLDQEDIQLWRDGKSDMFFGEHLMQNKSLIRNILKFMLPIYEVDEIPTTMTARHKPKEIILAEFGTQEGVNV